MAGGCHGDGRVKVCASWDVRCQSLASAVLETNLTNSSSIKKLLARNRKDRAYNISSHTTLLHTRVRRLGIDDKRWPAYLTTDVQGCRPLYALQRPRITFVATTLMVFDPINALQ